MEKFVFLDHTADIKFKAFGRNLEEVFENSADAVLNAMFEGKVEGKIKKKIAVKGEDLESLMYNFIEEILFLLDSEEFLISTSKVKISHDKKKLTAEINGDDTADYPGIEHIKSVTYNEMHVKKTQKGWEAQVVLDV